MNVDTKWVVDIKGKPNSSFEITVLRNNNIHGKKSYGWMDANKKMISSSGGPCGYVVDDFLWSLLVNVAHEYAKQLNDAEKQA